MRYTKEMQEMQKSREYPVAYKILNSMLKKEEPDIDALSYIHSDDIAKDIAGDIKTFCSDPHFRPGKLREHNPDAPTIFTQMRDYVNRDEDFKAMDGYFKSQVDRTESIDSLVKEIDSVIGKNIKNKFGPYSEYVTKITASAIHHQLARKCGISAICHWTGDAGLVYYAEQTGNIPKHKNPYFRITVAYMHDFIEDLSTRILHPDGHPYGLYRTDELARDYLPPEENIIKNVFLLTNIYSQLLKHAFYQIVDKEGKVFTEDGLKGFLEKHLSQDSGSTPSMRKIHSNILDLMEGRISSGLKGRMLLESLKWETYEFYVRRICLKSQSRGDDTAVIVKFGDQNYNIMGKDDLSYDDQEKLFLKSWMWSSEVYKTAINLPHIDNFVMELLEDALCHSEYHILKGLMNTQAPRLFYESAFKKIKRLSPIFYTDKRINHTDK